jgi:hypothetical protein
VLLERKENGYRDSHEAGVFVSDGGMLCLWTRDSHSTTSNKGCNRASLAAIESEKPIWE